MNNDTFPIQSEKNTSHLTLALYQQDIVYGDAKANHDKVRAAFEKVNADILIVPETFTTGFGDQMAALAEDVEGPTLQFARAVAAEHDAMFIGTWTVRESAGVVNRLHWVYPDGSYGHYDKAHTFRMSSEASQLVRGTQKAIFEWRGWRIKPAVCYDLRFPKWLRNAMREKAAQKTEPIGAAVTESPEPRLDYDLLVVCANWPASRHEAWETLLKARAIENLCYVAGAGRVGSDDAGIDYSGDSGIIDFKGQPIAAARPCLEEVITATISGTALTTFREHWPFYLDFD